MRKYLVTERVIKNYQTKDNVPGAVKWLLNEIYICKSCDLSVLDAYYFA